MQQRHQPKTRTPVPKKCKSPLPKPKSPPKTHRKIPKTLLIEDKQGGSKRTIPRKSYGKGNNLSQSVGELPLQNIELKDRLMRGDKWSSGNEESMRSQAQHVYPNKEYFGNSHSFLPHLDNSKQSGGSKHSKGSKTSSQSKSASLVEEKIKQYRAL